MSNNPGRKGKPAPWIQRSAKHKENELEAFKRANHAAYDAHCEKRHAAARVFREKAALKFPDIGYENDQIKDGHKRLSAWDRRNPSPLTWEDHQRLEAEFEAQYVPVDFS